MSLIFYHFTLSDGRTICGSPVELEGAHVGRSHSEIRFLGRFTSLMKMICTIKATQTSIKNDVHMINMRSLP